MGSWTKKEHNWKAQGWKTLMGPAMLIDGIVTTVTLGFYYSGLTLKVSRNLAFARINDRQNKVKKYVGRP